MLIKEADRQKAQFAQCKSSGKGKDDDEALAVGETLKGKKQKGKKNVECWNCGKIVINVLIQKSTRNKRENH